MLHPRFRGRAGALTSLLAFLLPLTGCSVVDVIAVSGPNETDCGGFDFRVRFELEDARPNAGWLIQRLDVERNTFECNDTLRPGAPHSFAITFYEAWRVPANQTAVVNPPPFVGAPFNDIYTVPDEGTSYGTTEATGTIRFFENVTLPAHFVPNNPNTFAGVLPSSRQQPAFWNTVSDEDDHDAENEWDCCDTPRTRSFSSTPTIGGLPTVPGPSGLTHPVARQIANIPPWTQPYGSAQTQALLAEAAGIAEAGPDALRAGLAEFTQARQDDLAELSKAYLLLRVLYDLPTALERAEAKTFGGWVHPSVLDTGKPFDLLWPLAADGEGGLRVADPFGGYFGAPYDAVGENAYFESKFARRR